MNSITCPKCGRTSYHPQDIKAQYCGYCHDWTSTPPPIAMDGKYKLECKKADPTHVKFAVYDPVGANCGTISVLTSDVRNFVARSWNGNVDWKEWETQIP